MAGWLLGILKLRISEQHVLGTEVEEVLRPHSFHSLLIELLGNIYLPTV